MVDELVHCDHIPLRLTGLFVEHETLFAIVAIGAGTKFLPCDATDLIDSESFENRARDYFGEDFRHGGEWPVSLGSAMRQAVAA